MPAIVRGMENDPDLVTLADLARRLRVSAAWIRAEADAGRLPHVRAGSQRLFNLRAVLHLLAERAARLEKGGADGC
jgi:excisionase family DNA binding protein